LRGLKIQEIDMEKRTELLMKKASEKQAERSSMRVRGAALVHGMAKRSFDLPSVGDVGRSTGALAGAGVGGIMGAVAGGMGAHDLAGLLRDKGGKYRPLLTLLGILGGGAFGGTVGKNIGAGTMSGFTPSEAGGGRPVASSAPASNAFADQRRRYLELLEMAEINRRKALADAEAMRAYSSTGLAVPPYGRA